MGQGPIATQISGLNPSLKTVPLNCDVEGNLLVTSSGDQDVGLQYATIAASTTQALGSAGAIGDTLNALTIIPGTTSPGQVEIKDGSSAAIIVFEGGATSVADLKSFTINLGAASAAGGWSVITGANVTALASGKFA